MSETEIEPFCELRYLGMDEQLCRTPEYPVFILSRRSSPIVAIQYCSDTKSTISITDIKSSTLPSTSIEMQVEIPWSPIEYIWEQQIVQFLDTMVYLTGHVRKVWENSSSPLLEWAMEQLQAHSDHFPIRFYTVNRARASWFAQKLQHPDILVCCRPPPPMACGCLIVLDDETKSIDSAKYSKVIRVIRTDPKPSEKDVFDCGLVVLENLKACKISLEEIQISLRKRSNLLSPVQTYEQFQSDWSRLINEYGGTQIFEPTKTSMAQPQYLHPLSLGKLLIQSTLSYPSSNPPWFFHCDDPPSNCDDPSSNCHDPLL